MNNIGHLLLIGQYDSKEYIIEKYRIATKGGQNVNIISYMKRYLMESSISKANANIFAAINYVFHYINN